MWILAGIAVLSLTAWFAAVVTPKLRTDHMAREEVIDVIERFLSNASRHSWEWDDFVSVPLDDARLDRVRQTCELTHTKYPPALGAGYTSEDGLVVIQELLKDLRAEELGASE